MAIKKCARCGAEADMHGNAKYCSACANIASREKEIEKYQRNKERANARNVEKYRKAHPVVCSQCRASFVRTEHGQKLCPKCRGEKDVQPRGRKKQKPMSLAETDRAAKAEGLSYGQYMAKRFMEAQ